LLLRDNAVGSCGFPGLARREQRGISSAGTFGQAIS
jgi:hypothetical protein